MSLLRWCAQASVANASTFTPALTASDAQVWRRSCGVMSCTSARFTAAWNHPVDDFGRRRYATVATRGTG